MKCIGLWSPGLRKFFLKNLLNPPGPSPAYLMYAPLDDVPLSDVVIVHIVSRPYSSLNDEKVIYDSNQEVKQQIAHRRMRF